VSTFVSVGNATQPFPRLLDAVCEIADRLPQPVFIQHGSTPIGKCSCTAVAFVEMGEFERLVAKSDLLIIHAGAGSMIHAARAGRVPVVMPRRARHGELVDDHQVEFARLLARSGRIVLVEEPADLESAVATALSRQRPGGGAAAPSAMAMLQLVAATLDKYANAQR